MRYVYIVLRIEMVDTALEPTASESEASNSIKEEEEEEAEQNLSPKKSKSDGVIPGQGSDDQAADTVCTSGLIKKKGFYI